METGSAGASDVGTWHVYIVRCADETLYTGIAKDVAARIQKHNAGRGAAYTRGRGPVTLVHSEAAGDRGSALRREAAIKRLPSERKLHLVSTAAGRR